MKNTKKKIKDAIPELVRDLDVTEDVAYTVVNRVCEFICNECSNANTVVQIPLLGVIDATARRRKYNNKKTKQVELSSPRPRVKISPSVYFRNLITTKHNEA